MNLIEADWALDHLLQMQKKKAMKRSSRRISPREVVRHYEKAAIISRPLAMNIYVIDEDEMFLAMVKRMNRTDASK